MVVVFVGAVFSVDFVYKCYFRDRGLLGKFLEKEIVMFFGYLFLGFININIVFLIVVGRGIFWRVRRIFLSNFVFLISCLVWLTVSVYFEGYNV